MKKMYYFINLFFITSIMGFFLEQGIMFLAGKSYNSSLLQGPWTIVYGVASIIILTLGDKISHLNIKKYQQIVLFLITTFLLLSALEYMAGNLIEKILGIVYWDYTSLPLHIGKYICVPISIIWIIYASILNYWLYPKLKALSLKIPHWITILLLFLFFLDIGNTIFEYLYYR